MNAMHERLKQIRDYKKMNQADFAKLLGIAQSSLAMMEVGKRVIQDRHIKMICSICNINEKWFRHGTGDMLLATSLNSLGQLAIEYNLTEVDQAILKIYISLPNEHRKLLFQIAKQFVDAVEGSEADPDSDSRENLENAAQIVENYL